MAVEKIIGKNQNVGQQRPDARQETRFSVGSSISDAFSHLMDMMAPEAKAAPEKPAPKQAPVKDTAAPHKADRKQQDDRDHDDSKAASNVDDDAPKAAEAKPEPKHAKGKHKKDDAAAPQEAAAQTANTQPAKDSAPVTIAAEIVKPEGEEATATTEDGKKQNDGDMVAAIGVIAAPVEAPKPVKTAKPEDSTGEIKPELAIENTPAVAAPKAEDALPAEAAGQEAPQEELVAATGPLAQLAVDVAGVADEKHAKGKGKKAEAELTLAADAASVATTADAKPEAAKAQHAAAAVKAADVLAATTQQDQAARVQERAAQQADGTQTKPMLQQDGSVNAPAQNAQPNAAQAAPVAPQVAAAQNIAVQNGGAATHGFEANLAAGIDIGAKVQASHYEASSVATLARTRPGAQAQTVHEQVSVNLFRAAKNGDKSLNIQLHPAELGRVEVKLETSEAGRVRATITADNQQTLDLLRKDSGSLERALTEAGLKLDSGSLNFNLRGGDQQNFNQLAQDMQGGNSGRTANNISLPEDDMAEAPIETVQLSVANGRVDIRA